MRDFLYPHEAELRPPEFLSYLVGVLHYRPCLLRSYREVLLAFGFTEIAIDHAFKVLRLLTRTERDPISHVITFVLFPYEPFPEVL